MESKTKELVKAGHELVVLLGNQHSMIDEASLVQRITAQLDITAAALREMTKKRDDEHADVLAWEKTMFKVCGEDGTKSVAAKFASLEARCAELAAENAALKSGAAYFSYGSEHNFEWHKTQQAAVEAAEAAIDDYRGDACDGWSEEVDSVCWGVIMQRSTKVGERPRTEEDSCDPSIDTVCDYALLPNIETPTTDAWQRELRQKAWAEGINYTAGRLAAAFNHGFVNKPMAEVGDVVRMILTTKEDIANDPAPAADGLSGEYAEKALEDWEQHLRNGEAV